MSSSHLVIIARNTKTGDLELPLGNQTLYGTGDEESILESITKRYTDDWCLAIYGQQPPYTLSGTKTAVLSTEKLQNALQSSEKRLISSVTMSEINNGRQYKLQEYTVSVFNDQSFANVYDAQNNVVGVIQRPRVVGGNRMWRASMVDGSKEWPSCLSPIYAFKRVVLHHRGQDLGTRA